MHFLLFGGDDRHPKGGWNDLQGTYSSVEYAEEDIVEAKGSDKLYLVGNHRKGCDWWHIVSLKDFEIVKQSSLEYFNIRFRSKSTKE